MTQTRGSFGFSKFGVDVFGWLRFGVPCTATVSSQELIDAVTQETPTPVGISATVLIDGVDYSSTLISVDTSDSASNAASRATLAFFNAELDEAIPRVSTVQVLFSFVLGSRTFSASIFRGKVWEKRDGGSTDKTVTLTCFDDSKALDNTAPAFGTYSGSALALIRSELFAVGIESVTATWTDYSVTSVRSVNYRSRRELIGALVNGKRKGYAFLDQSGTFQVIDAMQPGSFKWAIPLTGLTKLEKVDNTGEIYNRVQVVAPTLTYTYNDTEHQETNGILPTEVASSFIVSTEEAEAFGKITAYESQAQIWTAETPVNPFISLGSQIGIETEDNVSKAVRVEAINRSFSWPSGAWQTNTLRKITQPVAPVVLPETLLDAMTGGWRESYYVEASFLDAYYPQFTITTAKKIHLIITEHTYQVTPGTVTLVNNSTLDEYDFTMGFDSGFLGFHVYSSETGIEIPAGTYTVKDSQKLAWSVALPTGPLGYPSTACCKIVGKAV